MSRPLPPEVVAERLHSISIRLLRQVRQSDVKTGLSAPGLSALSVLVFGGPMSVSALAAAEQVRVPTISRLVKDLEEKGLIRRKPDPDDGRAFVLHATAKGKQLMEKGRRNRLALLTAAVARLDTATERELGAAIAPLEALLKEVGKA